MRHFRVAFRREGLAIQGRGNPPSPPEPETSFDGVIFTCTHDDDDSAAAIRPIVKGSRRSVAETRVLSALLVYRLVLVPGSATLPRLAHGTSRVRLL